MSNTQIKENKNRITSTLTGAEIMVKCLEKEGADIIFGYPGATICPFYDALIDSKIHHVLVRTEQNAAHAASGYARTSGKVGVCVATSGPGATNLVTGIASAYQDSIPLVIITGQVHSKFLGHDVFQEADITGAAEPFTKHSYLVNRAKDLPRIFKEAFHIAGTGRPGPVLIDIPVDMQTAKVNNFNYDKPVNIIGYKPNFIGHPQQIKKAITAIEASQHPIICIGGGVFTSHAQGELVKFVEKSQIPTVSTMMGISALPSAHPLYMGMIGTHGVVAANKAIRDADLVILAGARVGDRAVAKPVQVAERAKIIHIDIDPAEIGKNMPAHIPIVGDLKNVLKEFNALCDFVAPEDWVAQLQSRKKRYEDKAAAVVDKADLINPKKFFKLLSSKVGEDIIVVADVGQNQIWTANNFEIKNGRFLTSGGMGTMGYSIPCAVGAQLANPDKQVFSVCGDGSFQMSFMELATICQEKLPVKIIVVKNNRLGMVRELQKNQYNQRYSGVFLDGSPDFVKIAEAYGIPAFSISKTTEIEKAIDKFIKLDGPCIIECVVPDNTGSL